MQVHELCLFLFVGFWQCSAITPVQKVIDMLSGMKVTGVKELEVEKLTFNSYAEFVDDRTKELKNEVITTKAEIENLVATITKAASDITQLGNKIADMDDQTNQMEAEQKSATELRDNEHADFLEGQTDHQETLYALDRAIQMLKAQNYDRDQATMLLQKSARSVRGMSHVLALLALASSDSDPSGAPSAAAYEFQSAGIVDMLTNLQERFKEELATLEKEESNTQHAYSMMMLNIGNHVSQLKAERQELAGLKAQNTETAASAKGELADAKTSLADAEKFLADMKATHSAKKATFEANQKVRSEELEALNKAIEIMSDPNLQVKSLVQTPSSFLQIRSTRQQSVAKSQAAAYLDRRAKILQSRTLAVMAVQLSANPFAKVIDLVEDLITRLKEEAASEADHKTYCDDELRKNKLKREKMSSKAERLHAETEQKSVEIQDMANTIATLSAEQASLTSAVADATSTRAKEKAENEMTIKDSEEAQTAVKSAILVLKEFYDAQGAFVQVKQVPEMKAYTGMQGAQGGVVGMLEVIQSDFARVMADTKAAEGQAAEEYDNFMSDAKSEKKSKHDSEFKLGLKKDQAEFDREQLQKDLDSTQEQLGMANKYYEELKPQCVTVNVSFEERAGRRKEEIQSLQEAYKILDRKSSE